jgi:hypothetical protein
LYLPQRRLSILNLRYVHHISLKDPRPIDAFGAVRHQALDQATMVLPEVLRAELQSLL